MKNKIAIASAVLIFSFLFTACKKEKQESYTSVIGFWVGKMGQGTSSPNIERAFLFKTDGSVTVYTSADTGSAQKQIAGYNVTDHTLRTSFMFPDPITMEGTINSGFTRIEGAWGQGIATSGGGTFYMDKR